MTTSATQEDHELSEPAEVVKIGDLLIDLATGEVLEWPPGLRGDRIEYLIQQLVEAQRAVRLWQDAVNAYKVALGRCLTDAGLISMHTSAGVATWRTRTLRRGRPERVEEVAARYELNREQVANIWACASALDAKKLAALAEVGVIPREAVDDLVDVTVSRFVVVTPARPAPPTIERGRRNS